MCATKQNNILKISATDGCVIQRIFSHGGSPLGPGLQTMRAGPIINASFLPSTHDVWKCDSSFFPHWLCNIYSVFVLLKLAIGSGWNPRPTPQMFTSLCGVCLCVYESSYNTLLFHSLTQVMWPRITVRRDLYLDISCQSKNIFNPGWCYFYLFCFLPTFVLCVWFYYYYYYFVCFKPLKTVTVRLYLSLMLKSKLGSYFFVRPGTIIYKTWNTLNTSTTVVYLKLCNHADQHFHQ